MRIAGSLRSLFQAYLVLLLSILSCVSVAEAKQRMVLLPLDVSEEDTRLAGEYGSALQSGLKKRYTVFYGQAVEKVLEREYEKVDCSVEQCQLNVAIEFQADLIVDASVKKLGDGYILKMVVKDITTDEIIESPAVACRGCDEYMVLERLKLIGAGEQDAIASSSVVSQGAVSSVQTTNAKAILIFDSKPSGADVYIDGKKVGQTPYQGLDHRVGESIQLELREPNHRPHKLSVNLQQAITQLEPIALQSGQANITVVTAPFDSTAKIYINGEMRGKAPLQISVGTQELEIVAEANGKRTKIKKLKLKDGANEQVVLSFDTSNAYLNKLGISFVDIPAGSFVMGSEDGDDDERPIHHVRVPAFKMMTTEVTQRQWEMVMGNNPSGFRDCGKDCPVENTSWRNIQSFIKKLSELTGEQFRLPTESEWEYAARAGSTTKYSWGNDITCRQADFGDHRCRSRGTSRVASFKPNAFGLYDMHGNVEEWTQDCWNETYGDPGGLFSDAVVLAPTDGSAWMEGDCNKRVLRGGSWSDLASGVRSAVRSWNTTSYRYDYQGFRLVQD